MPEPPKALKLQGWLRSFGIFLMGVAGVASLIAIIVMANLTHDSLQLARENKVESDCRAVLANDVTRLQGEINSRGWAILVARFFDQLDDERLKSEAEQMNALVLQWRTAQDRRDRAEELCKAK